MSNDEYVGPFSVAVKCLYISARRDCAQIVCPWFHETSGCLTPESCHKKTPSSDEPFGSSLFEAILEELPRTALALPPYWDAIKPPTAININTATLMRVLVTF